MVCFVLGLFFRLAKMDVETSVVVTSLGSFLLVVVVLALLVYFTCRLASGILPLGAPQRF